jgi:GNAT superfamily N-acetyltransferase
VPPREPLSVDPQDLAPREQDRVAAALARVRLHELHDPGSAAFAAAYAMLAEHFLAAGELEDRDHLAHLVAAPALQYAPGVAGTYHMIAAWAGDRLVGVRDCYIDIDRVAGLCLVALSHICVAPDWRRTGLAAALRGLPLGLARRAVHAAVGRPLPTLVVAEMEPADPDDPATVVRLLAYGRSGFAVLDPRRVRYSQPEFRELPNPAHTALPLLAVVRTAHLDGPPDLVPEPLAEAFPRLFHVVHRTFLPAARVDPSEAHVRRHLEIGAPVPLLPLPTDPTDLRALAPLVRGAVLPLYPPGLRGPRPEFGDPAEELARLRLP